MNPNESPTVNAGSMPSVEVLRSLVTHLVAGGNLVKIEAEATSSMVLIDVTPPAGEHGRILGPGGTIIGALACVASTAGEKTGHRVKIVVSDESVVGFPVKAEYDDRLVEEMLRGVVERCAQHAFTIKTKKLTGGIRLDVHLSGDEFGRVRSREFCVALGLLFEAIGKLYCRNVMVDVLVDNN